MRAMRQPAEIAPSVGTRRGAALSVHAGLRARASQRSDDAWCPSCPAPLRRSRLLFRRAWRRLRIAMASRDVGSGGWPGVAVLFGGIASPRRMTAGVVRRSPRALKRPKNGGRVDRRAEALTTQQNLEPAVGAGILVLFAAARSGQRRARGSLWWLQAWSHLPRPNLQRRVGQRERDRVAVVLAMRSCPCRPSRSRAHAWRDAAGAEPRAEGMTDTFNKMTELRSASASTRCARLGAPLETAAGVPASTATSKQVHGRARQGAGHPREAGAADAWPRSCPFDDRRAARRAPRTQADATHAVLAIGLASAHAARAARAERLQASSASSARGAASGSTATPTRSELAAAQRPSTSRAKAPARSAGRAAARGARAAGVHILRQRARSPMPPPIPPPQGGENSARQCAVPANGSTRLPRSAAARARVARRLRRRGAAASAIRRCDGGGRRRRSTPSTTSGRPWRLRRRRLRSSPPAAATRCRATTRRARPVASGMQPVVHHRRAAGRDRGPAASGRRRAGQKIHATIKASSPLASASSTARRTRLSGRRARRHTRA